MSICKEYNENDVVRLLKTLGEDPYRPGLDETPERVIKAWKQLTIGYGQDPEAVLKVFEDGAERYEGMVAQTCIHFTSVCEHHMLPFFGWAHIGYIPNKRIVGLSKMARLTEIFAKRLQVQERLTQQIANALYGGLRPLGVGVVIHARHMCQEMRGVCKQGMVTETSTMLGAFRDNPETRKEFFDLVRQGTNGRHF